MTADIWLSLFQAALVLGAAYGLYWLCGRYMRPFHNRAFLCLLSILVGGWVVWGAAGRFSRGEGGFKLGVDLAGGTTLVYAVDEEKLRETGGENAVANLEPAKMVEFLKRRIDPNDLYNVTIRPVGGNLRYEIILPTGGAHQANIKQKAWDGLLEAVKKNWSDELTAADLDLEPDRERDLLFRLKAGIDKKKWGEAVAKFKEKYADKLKEKPDLKLDATTPAALIEQVKSLNIPAEELAKFLDEAYKPAVDDDLKKFIVANYPFAAGGTRKDFSSEMVEETKLNISKQGSLEFRIAANDTDDAAGIAAAQSYLENAANKPQLEALARRGSAPSIVGRTADDGYGYVWVELSKATRLARGLSTLGGSALKAQLAKGRTDGKPVVVFKDDIEDKEKGKSGSSTMVFYSRECVNERLTAEDRSRKAVDYFMLLRDPLREPMAANGTPIPVTGELLNKSRINVDDEHQAVDFAFDSVGADRFDKLTGANEPTPKGERVSLTYRHLAIVLDNQVESAPYLSSRIGERGSINMGRSPRIDRVRLVNILRSGALPATLISTPVSESTIGPTLGGDTIVKGSLAVGLSFAAVLVFMLIYYRAAGCVACVALLVNLLLTVAFMVFVNAAFTLPGLAGLVLMLGMAVDANILIYERLREERERGAGLTLALRNGYDRALPTILDTHITSFFTAVVLYAVGNDQLRGFGISLAAGLVISLFTSLVMTRLMFDVWQASGRLKELNMFKFLTKTSFDFMAIRYYWFTATIILTIVGLAVFIIRGEQSLNIDFVGGTAYGGQLAENKSLEIGELRALLKNQGERLAVESAAQIDAEGRVFEVKYKKYQGEKPAKIEFVEPVGGKAMAKAEREKAVTARASILPDWALVQTTITGDGKGPTRYFTVSTTEKDSDLVQVSVDRLLSEDKGGALESLLKKITIDRFIVLGKSVTLEFNDFASLSYLKNFLDREFRPKYGESAFELRGEGKSKGGRYKTMVLDVTTSAYDPVKGKADLESILAQTQTDFGTRPQPERLEKVDKVLAGETTTRAGYAILASWVVIALYLWFRFGNWTFGLAVVLCLIHDLCFTLGAIAFCHYFVNGFSTLASGLLIEDFKIDLTAIAALLTLIGYSVNDTIVVFDRIREVRGKNPLLTPQMINDSVNQTLSRTLLASMTVFLVVGVLYLFGGESIRLFAFVMVIGVIVGTYSSIYIASPLLLIFGEGAGAPAEKKVLAVAGKK